MANRNAKSKSGKPDDPPARSRSRSPIRTEEKETISVSDFQRMMVETMRAQMPTMIIEASKVARASLTADRDESNRAMAAEIKSLKQSHADLALMSKANGLKSDGTVLYISTLLEHCLLDAFCLGSNSLFLGSSYIHFYNILYSLQLRFISLFEVINPNSPILPRRNLKLTQQRRSLRIFN